MNRSFFLLMVLAGCFKRGDDDTGSPAPETGSDGGGSDAVAECDFGTSPVFVSDPTCDYPGLIDYSGDPTPTIAFDFSVSDADADLDVYTVTLYLEDDGDGSLDPDSATKVPGTPQVANEEGPGSTPTLNITQTLFLPSGSVTYDAPYDWGLMVTDSVGCDSLVAVVTCNTPAEDGSGGDGQ